MNCWASDIGVQSSPLRIRSSFGMQKRAGAKRLDGQIASHTLEETVIALDEEQ